MRAGLLALTVLCAACGGRRERAPVDPSLATIDTARLSIQHGDIGAGDRKRAATYVLVDVRSHATTDLFVALEGELRDRAGAPAGRLATESLRVPPGGLRTFALVHHGGPVPGAVGADLRLAGTTVAAHPAAVEITDGHVYQDGDRVVVAGMVVNRTTRQAYATVIAGFHDAGGAILSRPFAVVEIAPGGRRPTRFVGPPGSAEAYLFVGEELF